MWILVPWPEIKPTPLTVKAWNLNYWIDREVLKDSFIYSTNQMIDKGIKKDNVNLKKVEVNLIIKQGDIQIHLSKLIEIRRHFIMESVKLKMDI